MRYKLAIVDEYDEVVWTFRYLWLAITRRFRKPAPYVPLDPNAPGALFLDEWSTPNPKVAEAMLTLIEGRKVPPPIANRFWHFFKG